VLAIAAARALPHTAILASDNDPQATAVARANVRHNGAGGRVTVLTAQGLAHPRLRGAGSFDLVMANILAGPLIRMAPAIARCLTRGGVAVLSGLIPEQANAVRNSYVAAGLRVVRAWTGDGWTTLTLQRGRAAISARRSA
jgi:ribosomal protein L11 methyltransferase